jgi:hypothetical protein
VFLLESILFLNLVALMMFHAQYERPPASSLLTLAVSIKQRVNHDDAEWAATIALLVNAQSSCLLHVLLLSLFLVARKSRKASIGYKVSRLLESLEFGTTTSYW